MIKKNPGDIGEKHHNLSEKKETTQNIKLLTHLQFFVKTLKKNHKTDLNSNKIILLFILQLFICQIVAQKHVQFGKASYYADKFNGRHTANGEIFCQDKLTAAHPSLPFNTLVKITNIANNKSVEVRINDRGPFGNSERIIDLSKAAAQQIDMLQDGVVSVKLEVIKKPGAKQDNNTQGEVRGNCLMGSVSLVPVEIYGILLKETSDISNLKQISIQYRSLYNNRLIVQTLKKEETVFQFIIGSFNSGKKAADYLNKINITGKIIKL